MNTASQQLIVAVDARIFRWPTSGSARALRGWLLPLLHEEDIGFSFYTDSPFTNVLPVSPHLVRVAPIRCSFLFYYWFVQRWISLDKANVFLSAMPLPPFKYKVPKIIMVPDLTVEETPFRASAKQRLHRALGIVRSSIRTADHIIAISRDTAIRLQYHYQIDPSCISVLYLAADQNFRPMQPNIVSCYLREISPSLAINNYVFCIDVGSMVPVVLQAFARALRQLGHDQLFLVLRENISRATRDLDRTVHELQIAHRVVWIKHHIPDPTLIALYNGARCLCYPSPYEGFGLPAMEAMSCGCPVIGAKAGALPEIVNEAGLLVNSSSAVEIAHAIVKVATDEHLRQYLRRRGLTRSSQFTYEHSAQQLKLLLRSIACRN